jgi:hypothetical protein
MQRREIITSHFPGTAIHFALYVLDHPEELAAAQKMAEDDERAWKEHQGKQPPEA